jgi:hypothetical protein
MQHFLYIERKKEYTDDSANLTFAKLGFAEFDGLFILPNRTCYIPIRQTFCFFLNVTKVVKNNELLYQVPLHRQFAVFFKNLKLCQVL